MWGKETAGKRPRALRWKVGWVWPRVSHLGTLLVVKVIRLPF